MTVCSRTSIFALTTILAAAAAWTAPLTAQEIALKGGIAISRFQAAGPTPFDGTLVSTAFGGHARFYFGRFALQPELQMVSRGAKASESALEERMRLEYMEIPLMFVIPFRLGAFEPYAFGGPMISLETRCRSIIEENDLKTNFDCDDRSAGNSFERSVIDYGASAGAGVSHRLGSGRVLLEGRHTWGLRDIYDGEADGIEVRNRSFVISVGYAILPGRD
jgi:hypothetical protein